MWLLNVYKCVQLKYSGFDKPALFYNNDTFNYIVAPWSYKRLGCFVYVNKNSCSAIDLITLETRNIRFRYAGKAYRISKKRRVLVLTLHYPTFKAVIWNNIKLYHRRKKRKIFKFKLLTSGCYKRMFYQNIFKLRVPDTYTRRGILNNLFSYQSRKQRAATHR